MTTPTNESRRGLPNHLDSAFVATATTQPADGLEALLVGESAIMHSIRATIRRIAPSDLPVLIAGPTGSGKELVATALHRASNRRGNLVAVNVAAVPSSMFESIVFGHVKGAFSGAISDHTGYAAEANDGTLFLDEIGELPTQLQTKLLRTLELGTYRPVGATRDRRSSFRLVAATNQPIDFLRTSGRMRSDLLYRIAVIVVDVPPLAARREDIALLARHFAAAHCDGRPVHIEPDAIARLMAHDWPGNVRELKGIVDAALVLDGSSRITVRHVERLLHGTLVPNTSASDAVELTKLLERHRGDVTAAAREVNQHRSTLYRRLHRSGLTPPFRSSGNDDDPENAGRA